MTNYDVYAYVCMYAWPSIRLYMHMSVCMHEPVYECICICLYVYMTQYTIVYVYVNMYTWTSTRRHLPSTPSLSLEQHSRKWSSTTRTSFNQHYVTAACTTTELRASTVTLNPFNRGSTVMRSWRPCARSDQQIARSRHDLSIPPPPPPYIRSGDIWWIGDMLRSVIPFFRPSVRLSSLQILPINSRQQLTRCITSLN